MASRIPRLFQRVVYRHRRSINLVYNEARELHKRFNGLCLTQSTASLTTRNNSMFTNGDNNNNINNKQQQHFPVLKKSNYEMSTLSLQNSKKQRIEFETFNHPKIDVNVFETNLKQFWHFIPKIKSEINNNHIAAIEFEHESGSPCYPTIVVNQLHYEKLSKNTKKVIDGMIQTIPNNQQLNPSLNQDFLVCGRIWEPITNEQFDLVNKESKFAASLSIAGIFPKKTFSQNDHNDGISDEVALPIVAPSEVQAIQAGINLEHVFSNSYLNPTAMVTFREMLATSNCNSTDDTTYRAIAQRF